MAIIRFDKLTKTYGRVTAVSDLSLELPTGKVIGFLGSNGAGKTTSLRVLLGLVRPTAGGALIDGRRYAELAEPRRMVGAVLEHTGFQPVRSARNHLRVAAAGSRIAASRVGEVLAEVGLDNIAERKVGTFSMGQRQRLGLATALLGDPRILVLDEPTNGLDPEGIAWLRQRLRALAAAGRTVIISSHLLSEVAQTVDHVVILTAGELRYAGALSGLAGAGGPSLEEAFLRLTAASTERSAA